MTVYDDSTSFTFRGLKKAVMRSFRWVPNALTTLRGVIGPIVLAIFVAWAWFGELPRIWGYDWRVVVLSIVTVAIITDGADGGLARIGNEYGWKTNWGALADPVADKSLAIGVFVGIFIYYGIGWYLLVYIPAGGYVFHCGMETSRMRWEMREKGMIIGANGFAKLKTGVLMAIMLIFLVDIAFRDEIPGWVRGFLTPLGLTCFVAAALLSRKALMDYRRNVWQKLPPLRL